MHRDALNRLLYAITNQKGCALLTGEYGCGKTALVRKIIDSLPEEKFDLALVNYPIFTAAEFLKEVLFQFGVDTKNGSKLEMFHRISELGFESLRKGKTNLMVIDEAQLIEESDIFEQIRLLLNMQLEDGFLISIFLVGQPELREKIMEYPQLDQRVSVRYHLHYFGHEDLIAYIRHRLAIAGVTRDIFTAEAYYLVFKISNGIPRRINNLCDLCLLEGSAVGAQVIDESIVKKTL